MERPSSLSERALTTSNVVADEEVPTSSGINKIADPGGNKSHSEIEHILICDHPVSDEEITDMANKILRSSSTNISIEFCDCDLKADHLKSLCDKIKNALCQITAFKISYMDGIHHLFERTCFIVQKYKTTSLSFEFDELNNESVELFQDYLEDAKIESLRSFDISYNEDITATGFEKLGKIFRKFNIVSLKATACDITDEKLKKFADGLGDKKLKELDIGRNTKLSNEVIRTLAKFVTSRGVDYLGLSGCTLSKENIDVFHESLSKTGQKPLIKELDVNYNSEIEPDSYLGSVVVKCGITKLSMAGCKLRKDHLVCLRETTGNHEMELVNLRDNASIGQGIKEIAKLVIQCKVKELNICDCIFSAQELQSFRKTLDGAKVNRLHLGDQEREPDKKYVDELCALLENVEDVLYLKFHKLRDDFRNSLKDSCRNSAKIILTVDDKKEEFCSIKGSRHETSGQSVNESTTSKGVKRKLEVLENEEEEDLLEMFSPKIEKDKRQHIESHLENMTSTKEEEEDLLKMFSQRQHTESHLENMMSTKEDIEVVFKNEVAKLFNSSYAFTGFAESAKGLGLDKSDIERVFNKERSSNIMNVAESQIMPLLQLWKEKKGRMATSMTIREIVKRFYNIERKDFINLLDGRVRVFEDFELPSKRDLCLGEISNSTSYRFCAIKMATSSTTEVLSAAKRLSGEKHKNVVSVLDADTNEGSIYIVTELAWTTSLQVMFDRCCYSKLLLQEHTALDLARQMLLGLDFLHGHSIIHGNVNPENIFVSDDKKQLKLSNFEQIKVISNEDSSVQSDDDSEAECRGSDISSAALVLAQLFSSGQSHNSDDQLFHRPVKFNTLPNLDLDKLHIRYKYEAKEVILRMLDPNPKNRPTAPQVLGEITYFQYPFQC